MTSVFSLSEAFNKQKEEIIQEFFTFLRFSSISSERDHQPAVIACAEWLQKYLKDLGFKVELWQSKGHPVIFAHMHVGEEKPTLLIYNHYDVQPVDPLSLWETPPFEPVIKKNSVYARGAQDNKGQCFYVLQALKALLKRDGTLPVNVKLCIEGEEEMGSQAMKELLPQKAKELKADYLAIVDLGIPKPNTPAITLGIRGIICLEVEIEDSRVDLHSGAHGGIVYNPIHALVELLAKLHDTSGKVAIPGFYQDVLPISEKSIFSLDFDAKEYQKEFGTEALGGEKEYSPMERVGLRPTLEINGITGGYSGPGFKTVIPALASAKISCRLVPDQKPEEIADLVSTFLKKEAPKGLKVKVGVLPGGGVAVRTSSQSKVAKAFAQSYKEVFNKPCEYILCGGSIPIVAELTKVSKAEVVLLGMGLTTDLIHAPNEHFGLDRLEQGYLMFSRALEILGNS